MPSLEDTIIFVTEMHRGQVDKAGAAYILHVLRVMLQGDTVEERCAGALHDVVEDCGVTLDDLLNMGYSPEIVEAVGFLTKLPEEENDYQAFIERVARGPRLAQRVKIADLRDNADLSRFSMPTPKDMTRREKYLAAIQLLESVRGE